jgi:6-pyruvoyltetrahydropterin/6-carboxytetrahydropterin synthase
VEPEMIYYSEKFEFAAMHKLWNEKFDQDKNFEVFGKCANPNGHGHNYVAEVTVQCDQSCNLAVGDFERAVNDLFIERVDHCNLNTDVDYFSRNVPTVEKISEFAWEALEGKIRSCRLHSVTIWENDRTSCTFSTD